MSSVQELKHSVSEVGSEAKKIAEIISSFSRKNRDIMNESARTLKGSSQSVDRDVANALQDAAAKLDKARKALEDAFDSAKKYADSL